MGVVREIRKRLGLYRIREMATYGRILPMRAAIPASTHLPVLVGLSRIVEIKSVLELGCGLFSTLAYLNRNVFRDLTRLDSIEDDRFWAEKVAAETKGDPRLTLRFVDPPVRNALADMDMAAYDIVFIDDSKSSAERSGTISEVLARRNECRLVVMHDFENPAYRAASQGFAHRFQFSAFNPMTGVAWDRSPLQTAKLRKLNRLLTKHAKDVAPGDLEKWIQIVDRETW